MSNEDADLDTVAQEHIPKRTQWSTDHRIRTFETYLEEKSLSRLDMSTC